MAKSGNSGKDAKSSNAASAAARDSAAKSASPGMSRDRQDTVGSARSTEAGGSKTGRVGGGNAGSQAGQPGSGGTSRGSAGNASASSRASDKTGSTSKAGSGTVGRGLAGAAGLSSSVGVGGNVSSTRQTDAKSSNAASAAARQATAPARTTPNMGLAAAARTAENKSMSDMAAQGLSPKATPSYRQAEIKSLGDMARQGLAPNTKAAAQAPSYRQAEEQTMAKENAWQDTLATVRAPEAGTLDPYNRLVDGRNTPDYADLGNMTIGQVRDYQRNMIAAGHKSTALGAYQIKASTLAEAVARTGIPETAKFTKATQDYLARDLVENRANQVKDRKTGVVGTPAFADRMANEWASFQGQDGVGKYDKDGVNKASVPAATVRGIASGLTSTGAIGTQAPTQTRDMGRQRTDRAKPANGGFPSTPDNPPTPTAAQRDASPSYRTAENQSMADMNAQGLGPKGKSFADKYLGSPPRPDNMNAAGPVGMGGEGGINVNVPNAKQTSRYSTNPASIPAGPVNASYPDGPAPQPPAPTRTAPAPQQTTPAPVDEAPEPSTVKAPLSTGQKVAAGAIDLGVGMIPGVGVAASIYNGLATVAGIPTIGGMAVNLLGDGSKLGTGGVRADKETGERRPSQPKDDETKESDPTPEIKRFRDIYLIPTVRRPTPSEKWSRSKRALGV